MENPNTLLKFVFGILQFGGIVIAGVCAFVWVKAGKDRDQEQRDNAQWGLLGGIAAFAVGSWLGTMTFPSLSGSSS